MRKEISIDDMKRMQIDILQSVHEFCVNNNLHYTLFYGSLLGAIRHKGYIPWDDDIDIALLRPDYEFFIKMYQHEYYRVYDYRMDLDYANPYAKVADTRTLLHENATMKNIGINIDVFPVDYLYDTRDKSEDFVRSLNGLKRKFRMKLLVPTPKNVWWKRIAICISKLFVLNTSLKDITQKEYCIVNDLYGKTASYVGVPVDPEIGASQRSVVKKEVFEKYVETKFENGEYMIIADYDQWLRQMYGDYMTPPSESSKTSPHSISKISWV